MEHSQADANTFVWLAEDQQPNFISSDYIQSSWDGKFTTAHEKGLLSSEAITGSTRCNTRSSDEPVSRPTPQEQGSSFSSLWLPAFVVVVPMLMLSVALLSLSIVYRVEQQPGLFPELTGRVNPTRTAFILVNYPATHILFLSSWTSTLAPCLGGCVMTLWMYMIAKRLFQSSSSSPVDLSQLPSPRQYGHILGLATASIDKMYHFVSYARRSETPVPLLLRRAAGVLTSTFLFSGAVLLCDTALHYTTKTVQFEKLQISDHVSTLSRALSAECLNINRTENNGFPCSLNYELYVNESVAYTAGQNEIFYLQHNTSTKSEIRVLPNPALNGTDMAIVLPPTENLLSRLDYRGSTVGASTTCSLISDRCNFNATGRDGEHSSFNCSPSFWGVLGVSPLISLGYDEPQDPNVPPLSFKPSFALQFGFFMDHELITPYNTEGDNTTDGWGDDAFPVMSDADLINPVHVAVAARVSKYSQRAGLDYGGVAGFFQGPMEYLDFVLSCQYQTFEVNYTWSNGTINDVVATPSPNGTAAEIYHGYHKPGPSTGINADLGDYVTRAVMQGNVAALLSTWSNLYSVQVMSVIGAFLSPVPNIAEQIRTPLLVSQVPIPALALLISSCLGYSIFGLVLGILAWRAREETTNELVSKLNLENLIAAAFGSSTSSSNYDTNNKDSSSREAVMPLENLPSSMSLDSRYSTTRPTGKLPRTQTSVSKVGVVISHQPSREVRFEVWPMESNETL